MKLCRTYDANRRELFVAQRCDVLLNSKDAVVDVNLGKELTKGKSNKCCTCKRDHAATEDISECGVREILSRVMDIPRTPKSFATPLYPTLWCSKVSSTK